MFFILVLEKLDTTNSSSDAAVDKKQVEYLLSMKMRKQEKSVNQSSSPDTDETTDEHGIIEKVSLLRTKIKIQLNVYFKWTLLIRGLQQQL